MARQRRTLVELVRDGSFRAASDSALIGKGEDLPWPAFAALQQRYRDGTAAVQAAVAAEFERLVRRAHEEATRAGETQAGEPFTLEHFLGWVDAHGLTLEDERPWVVEPFQQMILADLFRGVREVWAIIPEGNAKSTFFGGVALYHADHTSSPWVPIGAASRDQAEILFGQAGGFVQRSPSLRERFRVYEGYRKIKHLSNGGVGIKVYAGDKDTGDGVIPTLALVDEPHRHRDMGLYRLWKGKLGKRGGQIVAMSTAGEPDSEFEDMREAIRAQAEQREYSGKHRTHLRAEGKNLVYHEWMVRDTEAARDLEVVKEANPLAHITVGYLQEKLESLTLDYGTDWLRLTCNIPTRSSLAAVPEADWDACRSSAVIPEGIPVAVGADFAWLEDTTALVPLWVKSQTERLFGTPIVLQPPGDGTMLDAGEVKAAFTAIHERNQIELLVADPAKAQDIIQWAERELGCTVIARSQANEFAVDDYNLFMEAVRERWIQHDDDPVFRKHVLSAIRARLPGDKYRFDRPRSLRKARRDQRRIVIDALTAAAMVHSALVNHGGPSVYESRGVLVF